jgi:hypothetical protein
VVKYQAPKRDDDAEVRRWRGPLFCDLESPLMWKDKYYKLLDPPNSVTFPICAGCGHVIWDWPHFEEEVPAQAICSQCFTEDQQ